MPHKPGGDLLADLSTDPIFDDAVYFTEALILPSNQNEDDLDAQLALSARESGIEDPYRFLCPEVHDISTAVSTMTVSSEQRSSISIHSRETQSTGFTSHPSRRGSRDNTYPYIERSPIQRTPPPLTRASLSLDHYDSVMERFRPNVRHRYSSSTFSAATSVLSNTSSLPKPTPRKHKRASGLFSMFRRDSSTCPSRSRHSHHVKPQSPKLECGHSLSKYAIRIHIQEALDSKEHVAPSCCGKPLPRALLETVLTKEETDIVTESALQSPDSGSARDSGYGEEGILSIDLPPSLDILSQPSGLFVTAPSTSSRDNVEEDQDAWNLALAHEALTSLKAQQKEQFQRVSSFESNQRKALSAHHQWSLKQLTARLETGKEEKAKQHILELERLDEFQIEAEDHLRKSHDQETQNVATALKYMEAYCSGLNASDPDITHTVTAEDRKKLARQHLIQQKLPAKHESAINVLRARQEREAKVKLQKQQDALQQMETDYENDKHTNELQYVKDASRLDSIIQARRRRIIHRWDLKFEMWRRDWENQHGITLNGRLPHEDWPEHTDPEAPINDSSSLALYLQVMG